MRHATTKEKDTPVEKLDSPSDFAAFAGVSSQQVRNWIRDGIIPTRIRAGRIIRFTRQEAMQALANVERGQAS